MDLITQLKEEHTEIAHLFMEAEAYAFGKDPNGSNLISSMREGRDLLLNHLKLEDEALYPKFENAEDPECNELGKKFANEMKEISKKTLAFFEKYGGVESEQLVGEEEFCKELSEIITAIRKRIKIEEEILYPAFGKC